MIAPYEKNGISTNCVVCNKSFIKRSRSHVLCSKEECKKQYKESYKKTEKYKEYLEKCKIKRSEQIKNGDVAYYSMVKRCKLKSKYNIHYANRGIKCKISKEDFLKIYWSTNQCSICGIQLQDYNRHLSNGRTIDRIDVNGHYENGNLRVVCLACNASQNKQTKNKRCKNCFKIFNGILRKVFCNNKCKNEFDYTMEKTMSWYNAYNAEKIRLIEKLPKEEIIKMHKIFYDKIFNNKKIILCGNGGSLNNVQHASQDMLKGIMEKCGFPCKAIALGSNPGLFSSISNDIGYEYVFSFELSNVGEENDLLICISVSGESKNIIKAIECAKAKNILVISITGNNGENSISKISDLSIGVDSKHFGQVEDIQMHLMHQLAYNMMENHKGDKNV